MIPASDRYKAVGRRDFQAAGEYLRETEFKLVGSHRIIRLPSEEVMELHQTLGVPAPWVAPLASERQVPTFRMEA
jgi:hypothetical protein